MKCSKCGFVSFDHLTECKRCGASLAGAREGLGFLAVRPATPFFLGSLLKESPKTDTSADKDLTTGGTLPAIDLHEGDDFLHEGPARAPTAAAPAPRASGPAPSLRPEDELHEMDLSDEDIDLLIADDTEPEAPREQTAGLKTDLGSGAPAAPEPRPSAAAMRVEAEKPAEEAIDFALEEISLELEQDAGGGAPEPPGGLRVEEKPAAPSGPPKAEAAPSAAEDDGLVLDLSDTDLEGLLSDLEETPPSKKKPSGGAKK